MDLIDEFISRYTKEYDFYDQVARLAAQELHSTLQNAGIRSIVTSRAKSVTSLHEKCKQRQEKNGPYPSVDAIFDDIVDLAGVRVALYFPGESAQVDGVIKRRFRVQEIKSFPSPVAADPKDGNRFSGYSAVHYRVQLNERALGDADKRYGIAKIEIQVASILMHAWSEVEHDLRYKPLAGKLSQNEYAILDQLNGLVMSGEIALEMLQRAGEARVFESGTFENHYELAAHLIRIAGSAHGEPIDEAGLGRIDLLFELLDHLNLDTPEKISPYIDATHTNFELRPLAEQIIDSLLAGDPDRYAIYKNIQDRQRSNVAGDDDAYHRQFGRFMDRWIQLERLIREYLTSRGINNPTTSPALLIRKMDILPKPLMIEFDQLRRMRNMLVHGIEPLSPLELADGADRLDQLKAKIGRLIAAQDGDETDEAPDEE